MNQAQNFLCLLFPIFRQRLVMSLLGHIFADKQDSMQSTALPENGAVIELNKKPFRMAIRLRRNTEKIFDRHGGDIFKSQGQQLVETALFLLRTLQDVPDRLSPGFGFQQSQAGTGERIGALPGFIEKKQGRSKAFEHRFHRTIQPLQLAVRLVQFLRA
ncbi:MAG: hypothetical protein IPH06_08840 [Alphaproteobacteria bacterium]|nr:hypothetical protein [Alphaproteobacteria bacterium]QQS58106.1 MAG: hypothetical protein IPN28_04600 [Alphaproteobacteria bacterium]